MALYLGTATLHLISHYTLQHKHAGLPQPLVVYTEIFFHTSLFLCYFLDLKKQNWKPIPIWAKAAVIVGYLIQIHALYACAIDDSLFHKWLHIFLGTTVTYSLLFLAFWSIPLTNPISYGALLLPLLHLYVAKSSGLELDKSFEYVIENYHHFDALIWYFVFFAWMADTKKLKI